MDDTTIGNMGHFILELIAPENGDKTAFSSVAEIISIIILSITYITLTYHALRWVWNTSKDGSPGGTGDNLSGRMAMLRLAVVTGLVAPVADGYSGVHLGIREVVKTSIYFADRAALALTQYIRTDGGIVPYTPSGITPLTKELLRAHLCMEAKNYIDSKFLNKEIKTVQPVTHVQGGNIFYSFDYDPKGIRTVTPNGYCGTFTLPIGDKQAAHVFSLSGSNGLIANESYPGLSRDEMIAVKATWMRFRNFSTLDASIAPIAKQVFAKIIDADRTASSATGGDLFKDLLTAEQQLQLSQQDIANFRQSLVSARDAFSKTNSANAAQLVDAHKVIQESKVNWELDDFTSSNRDRSDDMATWDNQIEDRGWMAVGYFTFAIQRTHRLQSDFAEIQIDSTSASFDGGGVRKSRRDDATKDAEETKEHPIFQYTGLLVNQLLEAPLESHTESPPEELTALEDMGDGDNGFFTALKNYLSSFFPWLIKLLFSAYNSTDGNLLLNLQTTGLVLTNVGEVLGAGLIVFMFATSNPVAAVTNFATNGAVNKLIIGGGAVLAFLALLGFFYAYILPFTFIMMWTMACLTWATNVCKLFILGPAWFASHGRMGGQDFVHESTRSGWMLIISVILRPSLLIATMALVHILYSIIAVLLSWILSALIGLGSAGIIGPLQGLFIIMIMLFTTYQLILRNHELLVQVPDQLIAIIGGGSTDGLSNEAGTERNTTALIIAGGKSAGTVLPKGSKPLPNTPKPDPEDKLPSSTSKTPATAAMTKALAPPRATFNA